MHFNPRSPYGERLSRKFFRATVSIFQSTLPVRGATPDWIWSHPCIGISIHAPRTGSDDFLCGFIAEAVYFNPRSPYGERLPRQIDGFAASIFQSTLPVRGATQSYWTVHGPIGISIHAPRTGSDSKNSQKVTLFLRQLNNFPKYHLGFPFLSRPTAFFSRKSVKKRSAKSPVFLVRLPFASKQSAHPREHRRPSPQNVRFCFHSGFQDSKTAGCPSPGP